MFNVKNVIIVVNHLMLYMFHPMVNHEFYSDCRDIYMYIFMGTLLGLICLDVAKGETYHQLGKGLLHMIHISNYIRQYIPLVRSSSVT